MPLKIDLSGKKFRFDLKTEGLGNIHVRQYSYSVADAMNRKFLNFLEAESNVFMRYLIKLRDIENSIIPLLDIL
jgi:hypothetical protein